MNQPAKTGRSGINPSVVRNATTSSVMPGSKAKPGVEKTKWPIWMAVVAGVLLPSLLIVILFRPNNALITSATVLANQSQIITTAAPITSTTTSSTSSSTSSTSAASQTPVSKMNLLPAANITANMIDHVASNNGVRVMIFWDGSQMNLDNFTLQQLPRGVQYSLGYSRGSDAK
jgi:cytoskeletal protein RodZ